MTACAAIVLVGACSGGDPEPGSDVRAVAGESSGSCGPVEETADAGADHLAPGEVPSYDEFPPASGPHDAVTLPAGAYGELQLDGPVGSRDPTWARAVHSLEHGYVIVLLNDVEAQAGADIGQLARSGRKVITAGAPESATDAIVLVAWRHVQRCERADVGAVASFIERFRETTAPEPNAP